MVRPSFGLVGCLPFGEQLLGGLGLAFQPGQTRPWYMRATSSPASSRWRVVAMSWRLAAAFWASAQLGRMNQGEHPVHDIDIRRQSDTAIPHVPSSFGEEFSSDSSGDRGRPRSGRPQGAEPRSAGASASQRLPAARPHRPVDALLASVSGGWGEQER
jgi:hypothetical protein